MANITLPVEDYWTVFDVMATISLPIEDFWTIVFVYESYAGESLVLLVGPPKPDRSKDRGQTRYDPPPPPTCRFSIGLTTLSCKNDIVTETAELP